MSSDVGLLAAGRRTQKTQNGIRSANANAPPDHVSRTTSFWKMVTIPDVTICYDWFYGQAGSEQYLSSYSSPRIERYNLLLSK